MAAHRKLGRLFKLHVWQRLLLRNIHQLCLSFEHRT